MEEAAMVREKAERLGVEDAVSLIVHAARGEEEGEARVDEAGVSWV